MVELSATFDANQAVANIAHKLSEVIAIYPITPASPMGEWADEWSTSGQANIWGTVPHVAEMQSEAGAAGMLHGAIQTGALTTTFTASQGLLLMLPNMYKIAGELSPTVFHVAARSVASHALSIFGDHSDVMAARMTGFGMLCSNSPQEAHDFALISHAATLESWIPILHFFDGFRTSHEIARVSLIPDQVISAMIDDQWIATYRQRALSPDHPALRGSSQNPDVFFQSREASNPHYQAMPAIVQGAMDRFAALTGRAYRLFEFVGDPAARHVIILMGSGAETVHETVDYLSRQGESVGLLKVRLYRPFDATALLDALPSSCECIAVLDRTKEPGADGEPLYKDVLTSVAQQFSCREGSFRSMPRIIGGRYGLASKEFTPGMVKRIFDELKKPQAQNLFTIGIHDDVSHTSLDWDADFRTDAHRDSYQAIFYGLGSDGTVGANKNSIKIIGETTDQHVQGYFVYDSKKAGAITVSHLRFGQQPIHSSYLIDKQDADFIACHHARFLDRHDMLEKARDNAVFLLNTTVAPEKLWESLPHHIQSEIVAKNIELHAIDAFAVAASAGMGRRINSIMQTCFFAITNVLHDVDAIAAIKTAVEKTYGRKGKRIIDINFKAIDSSLANLHRVETPANFQHLETNRQQTVQTPKTHSKTFTEEVTIKLIAGLGDKLPVSAMPVDGTFPTGTAVLEKRNLALELPVLETELCTQCGKCPMVCPHAAIRSKVFHESALEHMPAGFKSMPTKGKDFPEGTRISYQVSPEDCTGCTLCADICPIRDKSNSSRKALNMKPAEPLHNDELANWEFFKSLPEYDRSSLKLSTIKGAMLTQPLFEFSGACVGCGETPYIKLASQLFGDRMVVANATGCSSIYGGNLPTTPWTSNSDGRGPAWSNSLFEDNAEFGLGMRLAIDKHSEQAIELLTVLKGQIDPALVDAILSADQSGEAGLHEQRFRVDKLRQLLVGNDHRAAVSLRPLLDYLCRKSVWIVGGDGWAYDIGYGGVDHVLASGANVNILVLDTEVYSNTGGQTSKATPRGAVAKFSAGGKSAGKKDLALLAMNYENVYVAQVAYAGKDTQTLRSFIDAEAHDGPSLILAYSPCIAHGIDLANNHQHQNLAVKSGHWPLFRYDPRRVDKGLNPLHLDSAEPSIPYEKFARTEARFSMLWNSHPEQARQYLEKSQKEVRHRYKHYRQLSELSWQDENIATDDSQQPGK